MHVQLGLLVVALVALLAFTTRGLSLPSLESARVRRQGASPLLSRRLLEFAYYVLLPVARFAVATKVSPNVSSWMCLTVGLSAGVAGAQAVAGPGAISTCAAWSSGGSSTMRDHSAKHALACDGRLKADTWGSSIVLFGLA